MTALVWTANLLGWPAIQLGISFAALRLPTRIFAGDSWLTTLRGWERDGTFYRNRLAIRSWKSRLPDGASWLGGFGKKKLRQRDRSYLERFLVETRRAEWAHWCMISCLPLFFLWNPPWARLVMTLYALASNLPCILTQRYNRIVLERAVRPPRIAASA
ncbi:glycosyl-4,4'-diaponeurosporenoate acyltransferase [Acidobacteria bacterium AB60]|nr:glycosyl-4,4'-diaponeurosporenoate acyltransferase [Acidobacteria bacterium AB60]